MVVSVCCTDSDNHLGGGPVLEDGRLEICSVCKVRRGVGQGEVNGVDDATLLAYDHWAAFEAFLQNMAIL